MKYQPLAAYLTHLDGPEWRASFDQVERVLGFDLPGAARNRRSWWTNDRSDMAPTRSRAWLTAGFEVADVDMRGQVVTFRRTGVGTATSARSEQAAPGATDAAVPAYDRRRRVVKIGVATLGGGSVAVVSVLGAGVVGFLIGRHVARRWRAAD